MAFVSKRWFRELASCLIVWTLAGLYFFSQGLMQKFLSGDPSPWWHHLVSWMIGSYIAAFLTPLMVWLGRRFPFKRRKWIRIAALHSVFSVAFAIFQLALESWILFHLSIFPALMKSVPVTFAFLLMIGLHQSILTYWFVLGILYSFRYYSEYQRREQDALRLELRTSELKAQLTHAHLSALKAQLHPHFLFNTLNAIMVLVRKQRAEEAEEMLARLSDLLRCVLEDVDEQEIPLRRELDCLRLYLSIEKVRFKDRLSVDIAVHPDTLDAAFPQMGLQPIVENAIRHGIGQRSAAGNVRIGASRVADSLQITVQDDGPGFPPNHFPDPHGIGLANTRARLEELYGDYARLDIKNAPECGAVVTITLPFHLVREEPAVELMDAHGFDRIDR